jgi:WD40 repeat protein
MASGRPGRFVRRAGVAVLCAGAVLLVPRADRSNAEPPAGAASGARTDRYGDPLPAGALARFGTVRYRFGPGVTTSALTRDGKTLAVSSEEDVLLFDMATGRPRCRLRGVKLFLGSLNRTTLCFSPDGSRLVSIGGWEKNFGGIVGSGPAVEAVQTLQIWDAATGAELRRLDPAGGIRGGPAQFVSAVWFGRDGKEIGVMFYSGVARFLDAATGKEVRRLDFDKTLLAGRGATCSPDGKLLAVIDGDAGDESVSLRLFDAATGRERHRVKAAASLGCLAFSPDSATLAAADDQSRVRLYDVATGTERKSFPTGAKQEETCGPEMPVLVFSPDGKVLYGGNSYGQILRWRVPGGEPLAPMAAEQPDPEALRGRIGGLFFPPGGPVVSVAGEGVIRRWDATAAKEISPGDGFTGYVCCRLTPDGNRVAAGDLSGRLELFDAATGRSRGVLRHSGPAVTALNWLPDGSRLAVGQANDSVVLWDTAGRREVRVFRLPPSGGLSGGGVIAFTPDGRHMLTSKGGLRWWDVNTGKNPWPSGRLGAGGLAADGKTILAWAEDSDFVLLDAATGAVRVRVPPPGDADKLGYGRATELAPDGDGLAMAYSSGTVRFLDLQTGRERLRVRGPENVNLQSMSFSPDGKWLLSGWGDHTLRIWETATGKELWRRECREWPDCVQFGADFRTALASCGGDCTAVLWDLRPPAEGRGATAADLWADLGSDDGAKVYRATRALADDPKAAALMREMLPPITPPDEKRVRQVVARLDADAFADREKATNELKTVGSPVVPLLRKLLQEGGSAEARFRLQDVLDGLTARRDDGDMRRPRAVQVLELAATAEARQLLRDWAAGAASVALADDARAALGRLERAGKVRRTGDKP